TFVTLAASSAARSRSISADCCIMTTAADSGSSFTSRRHWDDTCFEERTSPGSGCLPVSGLHFGQRSSAWSPCRKHEYCSLIAQFALSDYTALRERRQRHPVQVPLALNPSRPRRVLHPSAETPIRDADRGNIPGDAVILIFGRRDVERQDASAVARRRVHRAPADFIHATGKCHACALPQ